jgi:hypothetical protein
MKVIKFIKLFLIVLPIAVMYGLCIAIITILEYIIDKCKVRY